VLLRMPLLLRGSVKINAAARSILREDGKDPSCDLGPPVHSWGSWFGTKQLDPWKKTLVGPAMYCWGSWSRTKQFDGISP
jgi:hypothetical protein